MLNKEVINKLVKEYKNGASLRKLSKTYNLNISRIYYHLNKKDVLRKVKQIKSLKNNNHMLIGTFIGLWAGDGSKFRDRWQYIIKIHMDERDKELLKFIKKILLNLFDKDFGVLIEKGTHKAAIRFGSKFIYEFIDKHLQYKRNKTLTVGLKNNISSYSNKFLKGFLLGLTLSDGHLKYRFSFTSISKNLISDTCQILKKFNYVPKTYKNPPHSYGKHEFYTVVLEQKQARLLKEFLNKIVTDCRFNSSIDKLKRYQ